MHINVLRHTSTYSERTIFHTARLGWDALSTTWPASYVINGSLTVAITAVCSITGKDCSVNKDLPLWIYPRGYNVSTEATSLIPSTTYCMLDT